MHGAKRLEYPADLTHQRANEDLGSRQFAQAGISIRATLHSWIHVNETNQPRSTLDILRRGIWLLYLADTQRI